VLALLTFVFDQRSRPVLGYEDDFLVFYGDPKLRRPPGNSEDAKNMENNLIFTNLSRYAERSCSSQSPFVVNSHFVIVQAPMTLPSCGESFRGINETSFFVSAEAGFLLRRGELLSGPLGELYSGIPKMYRGVLPGPWIETSHGLLRSSRPRRTSLFFSFTVESLGE